MSNFRQVRDFVKRSPVTVSYSLNAVYSHFCTCWRPTLGGQPGLLNICGPARQNWHWLYDDSAIVLFADRDAPSLHASPPYDSNRIHLGMPILDLRPDLDSVYPCRPIPPRDHYHPFWIYYNNPHQGGTNAAFVDGHVKWFSPERLNERTSTGLLKWWISFKLP